MRPTAGGTRPKNMSLSRVIISAHFSVLEIGPGSVAYTCPWYESGGVRLSCGRRPVGGLGTISRVTASSVGNRMESCHPALQLQFLACCVEETSFMDPWHLVAGSLVGCLFHMHILVAVRYCQLHITPSIVPGAIWDYLLCRAIVEGPGGFAMLAYSTAHLSTWTRRRAT